MSDTNNMTAQNDQSHVVSLMHKGGKLLSDTIAALILKGQEVDAAPVTVLNTLRQIYNGKDKDGNEVDNIRAEFPRLNTSSIKGDDNYVETNEYTERYEAPKTVDGVTKEKKLNFFTEAWSTLPAGEAQAFVLKQCLMTKDAKTAAQAEQLYKDMSNIQIDGLIKATRRAMSRGRTYLRKAVGTWYVQMDLLDITNDNGVSPVTLDPSDNGSTANSFPYDLVNNLKRGKYQPMSVADIIKLNVRDARAQGGDLYDALIAQLSRDSETTKNKYPVCENPEQIYDASAAIVNGLDDNDDLVTALKEKMQKKKGGAEYIRMIGALKGAINAVWTKSLQIAYERMVEKNIESVGEDDDKELAA